MVITCCAGEKEKRQYKFCIDFRKVNAVTIKDAQPLPHIDDTLNSLGDASYFSTLDLASGRWRLTLQIGKRLHL